MSDMIVYLKFSLGTELAPIGRLSITLPEVHKHARAIHAEHNAAQPSHARAVGAGRSGNNSDGRRHDGGKEQTEDRTGDFKRSTV